MISSITPTPRPFIDTTEKSGCRTGLTITFRLNCSDIELITGQRGQESGDRAHHECSWDHGKADALQEVVAEGPSLCTEEKINTLISYLIHSINPGPVLPWTLVVGSISSSALALQPHTTITRITRAHTFLRECIFSILFR